MVPCVRPCVRKLAPIPAVLPQNVTNKKVCVKSEKYASWVNLGPQSDCCHRGEAKVRILDFKTTWSESQKVSQTTTKQGKAEQCIFDLKTIWSEFQKPSQTAGSITSKIIFFKKSLSVHIHIHNSSSPVQLLLREAKPSYVYTILKNITSPESVPSSCVRQHT